MSDMLSVKGLSISFGGLKAVNNFAINIEKGQLYGLIGPNGAGKTTLVSEVARRIDPTVRVLVIPPEPTAEQCRDALSRLASLDSRSRGRVLAVGFLPLLFR